MSYGWWWLWGEGKVEQVEIYRILCLQPERPVFTCTCCYLCGLSTDLRRDRVCEAATVYLQG